jgi:hypothetical protein
MNKHKTTQQQLDLDELCALFSSADEWGQQQILKTARRQARVSAPAAKALPALALVLAPAARLDELPHVLDNPVNLRTLALVRQPVDA